ncbi:MAG TPA: FAD-dependent oxidoreductase [Nitrososphaeraceae archaeon]|jgi:electron transfer flavoprotein-quinone oxidoreductase|nr:FAD-dependent oxidoreductase [Nitrososphaeraceae archaeon]
MERYDVAVIGGGTSGLTALRQLSNLGKQAVLLEAGSTTGTKNVSGGILYSKKPKNGRVYNIEDVFGREFVEEAPYERAITQYILHATSKNKVYSIDLTPVHEYQINYAYSVLLSKLIPWLAKEASDMAEKMGGGMISGVHVRSVRWERDSSDITIETDELESFRVRAVIAADGTSSELAEVTKARSKFSSEQLYQGVKTVIKLPEAILEERFNITSQEGAAHLFAGDVTMNHIGGGFLYTNRDTISLGAVYHMDSLMDNPVEPSRLIDALIRNHIVAEFIKDRVPIRKSDNATISKDEEIRQHFMASKLLKSWNSLRSSYYSRDGIDQLIKSGKYKTKEEIESRINSLENELIEKYGHEFSDNYVELEYSARLIPDGKRCRMKTPYYKNVLFVGDAAGRGVFIGPRIEGLNVGIDDAVRAANAVARSLDRNNFDEQYLGNFYTKSVEESPYTRDMKEIDKEYLKLFLDCSKNIPKDIVGSRYGMIFKLMSSGTLRGIAVGFANMLGFDRLLPLVESVDTYVNVPIELADRLGVTVDSNYVPNTPSLQERIARLDYNDDTLSHIQVTRPQSEFMSKMVTLCPTRCYSLEEGDVILQHEGCIECGTCAYETSWRHPRGGKGVSYKYG